MMPPSPKVIRKERELAVQKDDFTSEGAPPPGSRSGTRAARSPRPRKMPRWRNAGDTAPDTD